MTIKEACKEIGAISNNMSLDYSYYFDGKTTKEDIIEDLQETIRMFNEIMEKLDVHEHS